MSTVSHPAIAMLVRSELDGLRPMFGFIRLHDVTRGQTLARVGGGSGLRDYDNTYSDTVYGVPKFI